MKRVGAAPDGIRDARAGAQKVLPNYGLAFGIAGAVGKSKACYGVMQDCLEDIFAFPDFVLLIFDR